jgi:hypothetical protein
MLQDSTMVSEPDMRDLYFWRALLVIAGLVGAVAACTDSVPRQDSGGASHDSSQPRTEHGGGGGGGY